MAKTPAQNQEPSAKEPKSGAVKKGSLGAFQKWGEALPEGDTKEAARELYRKAKAGEISQTDLQKLQAELQAQVDKRKAAAEAKSAPKETKPAGKATPSAKADAPKEGPAVSKTGAAKIKSVASNPAAKIKSVASNPAAKATADAVKAEAATAETTAAKTVAGAAKTAGKGIGKAMGKYVAPAYVGANVLGRGMELYKDLGEGKTIGEALNKPESNKQLAEAAMDTGLGLLGMRAGARFGVPGAVIGGIGLPLVGKLGVRAADVAIRGPRKPNAAQPEKTEPATPVKKIAYEEIDAFAKEKGLPFEDAFRQLQERQTEEVNKRPQVEEEIRKAEPASSIYSPSGTETASLAKEAVRAPIGQEPDIMSFLQQPDTEKMLAELTAKQASKVETAGNNGALDKKKKRETSAFDVAPVKTTNPANDRPLPRFYVNTGRFGTIAGAGSRRPLG